VSAAELARRLGALLGGPAVEEAGPAASIENGRFEDPVDLVAFYALASGVRLRDGTTILGRDEAAKATAWLIEDKSLDWDPELVLLGERGDLVIVRDPDRRGARAGGGVLEAPTDGLSSFKRVSLDLVAYLERRAGDGEAEVAPELAARQAIAAGDERALEDALARGFYPGAERELAHATQRLGVLRAGAGDEAGALSAFERAVVLRVASAPRGAGEGERASAWRALAVEAEKVGAQTIAALCKSRAVSG
jgi:hypothetical protein